VRLNACLPVEPECRVPATGHAGAWLQLVSDDAFMLLVIYCEKSFCTVPANSYVGDCT